MTELFRVTVGSRLYGLHTEESDHDRRGVKVSPLGELLLSADVGKNISSKDNDGDLTLYELNHFVRLLMKGNPTMLETWYSLSLENPALAEKFAPLLDSGESLRSLKGYLSGALQLHEKQPEEKKAWKNMAGGLTYMWLYAKLFGRDLSFAVFEPLVRGCRAGDAESLSTARLNLMAYVSMAEDTAQRTADVEYARELLVSMYTKGGE